MLGQDGSRERPRGVLCPLPVADSEDLIMDQVKMITPEIPVPMYERLRREAYERNVSQVAIVREALAEHFARLDSRRGVEVGPTC